MVGTRSSGAIQNRIVDKLHRIELERRLLFTTKSEKIYVLIHTQRSRDIAPQSDSPMTVFCPHTAAFVVYGVD